MKISKVVYLLKKHNPTTSDRARAVGIPMEFLNDGYYRKAYRVPGTPVVVKFPALDALNREDDNFSDPEKCIKHGKEEIKAIKNLLSSPFKKHAPKVYYANPRTGVVAMKFYKSVDTSVRLERLAERVAKHFGNARSYSDLHSENFGRKGKRGLVIRDLGMIG